MGVAQPRDQQRSLPRECSIPYIAELSTLELAIVKHSAVLALTRSPLIDQFDLEELLEMVEVKKSGFWNKLFKGEKKSIKKKGASLSDFRSRMLNGAQSLLQSRCVWRPSGASSGERGCRFAAWSNPSNIEGSKFHRRYYFRHAADG